MNIWVLYVSLRVVYHIITVLLSNLLPKKAKFLIEITILNLVEPVFHFYRQVVYLWHIDSWLLFNHLCLDLNPPLFLFICKTLAFLFLFFCSILHQGQMPCKARTALLGLLILREVYITDGAGWDILHFLNLLANRIRKEVLLLFMSEGISYFEIYIFWLTARIPLRTSPTLGALLKQGRAFKWDHFCFDKGYKFC